MPSAAWWKVKIRHEGRFIAVGLAMADGWPYALLVAAREGDRLYRGRVEVGVGVEVEVGYSEVMRGMLRDPVCVRSSARQTDDVPSATR